MKKTMKKTTIHRESGLRTLLKYESNHSPRIHKQKTVEHIKAITTLQEYYNLDMLETKIFQLLMKNNLVTEIAQKSAEIIRENLGANAVAIWKLNQEKNILELQGIDLGKTANKINSEILGQNEISLEGTLIGYIAHTKQAYLSQDSNRRCKYGFEIRIYQEKIAESCSLQTDNYFAGYPLIIDGHIWGILAIEKPDYFTDIINTKISNLTNIISMGIERVLLKGNVSVSREVILFRLANQIRNSLDLDNILGTAVKEIQQILKVDRCEFLWCWPHPTNPTVSVTHESCKNSNISSLMDEDSCKKLASLTTQIRQQQTVKIDNLTQGNVQEINNLLQGLEINSILLVPMKTRSGQLGAILCNQAKKEHYWSQGEVELLQAVVDQLAIAIDQAELFAQTRASAFAAQTQAKQLQLAMQELKQTEAHLIQAEKMSSLGQMVAGIAHEINNPVNFISGNLSHANNYIKDLLELIELYQEIYPESNDRIEELSESIDLPFLIEDLPKMINSMEMGSERIRQIVVSLRNFSRLDEAEKKPVNIHEGIDNTLLILHHKFKAVGNKGAIEIVKEYGDLPLIECYAGQLNQVFMNILSNAIDAIENQPDLRIITIKTELNKSNIIIRIRDNGPGIPENINKKLFDPFFTTKPVGKGTGLGLSISYQIVVEKHKGLIQCISEPGQGAEFYISIPL